MIFDVYVVPNPSFVALNKSIEFYFDEHFLPKLQADKLDYRITVTGTKTILAAAVGGMAIQLPHDYHGLVQIEFRLEE